jgi:hypothetical protein
MKKEEDQKLKGERLKYLRMHNVKMAKEEREKQREDIRQIEQVKSEAHVINALKRKIVRDSEDKGTEKLKRLHEEKIRKFQRMHRDQKEKE